MPPKYGPDAIERCRKFYCQFGGNHNEVEKAMREHHPSWSKQNLIDRDGRLGWINRYGFDKALEHAIGLAVGEIEGHDERRYAAIVMLADKWQERALSGNEKAVDKFIKLTQLQVELRSKLDIRGATFETFVDAFEQVITWAKDIDLKLAQHFYKRREQFVERAEKHYGKTAKGSD